MKTTTLSSPPLSFEVFARLGRLGEIGRGASVGDVRRCWGDPEKKAYAGKWEIWKYDIVQVHLLNGEEVVYIDVELWKPGNGTLVLATDWPPPNSPIDSVVDQLQSLGLDYVRLNAPEEGICLTASGARIVSVEGLVDSANCGSLAPALPPQARGSA